MEHLPTEVSPTRTLTITYNAATGRPTAKLMINTFANNHKIMA